LPIVALAMAVGSLLAAGVLTMLKFKSEGAAGEPEEKGTELGNGLPARPG
jgi:hypothetical protein